MIRGFYASRSGVIGQQQNMDIIANNFANINTTGYKAQQAAFSTLMYAKIQGGAGVAVSTGHGAKVQDSAVDYSQGGLKETGVPTDMAILGEGFFAVSSGDGEDIYYTRNGEFRYSVDGDSKFLVDTAGAYVLDPDGSPVELGADEELSPGRLGVYLFPNRHGLELLGYNRLGATEVSGEAEAVETPTVRQGCLERSGVSASEEIVRMIEASKAFSFNSRMLQTIDEMEGVSNQLR
ncbi:MAG: flagellar hook-basal body protein [Clostridiales Family XIII bacterium]|jgi:flagellar basal body rod protein FlgG|nr:flagellar hook-basal body protein [Clostridiales Family XIII bacterium]